LIVFARVDDCIYVVKIETECILLVKIFFYFFLTYTLSRGVSIGLAFHHCNFIEFKVLWCIFSLQFYLEVFGRTKPSFHFKPVKSIRISSCGPNTSFTWRQSNLFFYWSIILNVVPKLHYNIKVSGTWVEIYIL
jgi:hypothetical protein